MNNKIAFMIFPYLAEGIDFVLTNLTKVYSKEESEIYVFIDDEYHIKDRITDTRRFDLFFKTSKKYEVNTVVAKNRFTFCTGNYPEESKLKLLELFNRFLYVCNQSDAKWIVVLEDDVLVRKKITKFPTTDFTVASGGLCTGGIIYNREKLKMAIESYSEKELLSEMKDFPFYFAGDQLIKRVLIKRGLTFSWFQDHADGIRPEHTDAAVIHNIKDHYPPYYLEYRKWLSDEIQDNPMFT